MYSTIKAHKTHTQYRTTTKCAHLHLRICAIKQKRQTCRINTYCPYYPQLGYTPLTIQSLSNAKCAGAGGRPPCHTDTYVHLHPRGATHKQRTHAHAHASHHIHYTTSTQHTEDGRRGRMPRGGPYSLRRSFHPRPSQSPPRHLPTAPRADARPSAPPCGL